MPLTPEQRRAYMKSYRQRMTPEQKASQLSLHRKWYAKNRKYNVDRVIAWRKSNQDKKAAADKRYKDRHRELVNARMREWHNERRSPQSIASKSAGHHRRRALEKNAPGSFTKADVLEQQQRQRGRCYWCSKKIVGRYHIDHVMPLSRGGTNDKSNIVLACAPCNLTKRDRLPSEFAGVLL